MLAEVYRGRGNYAQAEALFTQNCESARNGLGEEHPNALECLTGLAQTYEDQRRYSEAGALFTRILATRRRTVGDDHPETLATMLSLGHNRIAQKQFADAESILREALAGYEKAASDEWQRYYSQNLLGEALAGEKKLAESEPLLTTGYDKMFERRVTMPAADRRTLDDAGTHIVAFYQDWGKPDKVAEWQRRLQAQK